MRCGAAGNALQSGAPARHGPSCSVKLPCCLWPLSLFRHPPRAQASRLEINKTSTPRVSRAALRQCAALAAAPVCEPAGALFPIRRVRAGSFGAAESVAGTIAPAPPPPHCVPPQPRFPNAELKFGKTFADHMLEMDWTRTAGWAAPAIRPYGPLAMDPAASVLHYGLECFEGMKAYIDAQGKIRLFRPEMNMARLNKSMARLGFPVRLTRARTPAWPLTTSGTEHAHTALTPAPAQPARGGSPSLPSRLQKRLCHCSCLRP